MRTESAHKDTFGVVIGCQVCRGEVGMVGPVLPPRSINLYAEQGIIQYAVGFGRKSELPILMRRISPKVGGAESGKIGDFG